MTLACFLAARPACGGWSPAALLLTAALAGCAAPVPGQPNGRQSADVRPASQAAPASSGAAERTIRDFAALRRCMDNLLVDYGTRDLAVTVEDLDDRARRSEAGSGDLLVAAVSGITQRSRAIRLVAADDDRSRAASAAAGRPPIAARPQYTLRSALRRLQSAESGHAGESLGLDLSLVSFDDASVVPGTAARNTVSLTPDGAELRKFGTQLSVSGAGRQDPAAALRALADVSAIELFGRLAKVPYWSCFGAAPSDGAVVAEVQDWYDTLASRPADIIGWFQQQLRTRQVYDGPLDGTVNPPLKEAVARYREALGLSREPKLTLDFFQAYLAADHRALAPRLAAAAAPPGQAIARPPQAPAQPAARLAAPAPAPRAAPLDLHIAAANEAQRFSRGDAVQLLIRPSRDAHVYCFLLDENRRITRFFPNRFQRDSRVPAKAALQLPGAQRFEITMNPRGLTETVTCFGTDSDVLAALPSELNGADFQQLPVASVDQLRTAFLNVTNGTLAQESFQIRAKP